MEDVLEVYQRPYDGNEALVCMDETSKQGHVPSSGVRVRHRVDVV